MVAWSKFSKTRLRGGADLLFFKMAENEGASEMKSGFRSVVIGGTGATGRCLVRELLKSKEFSEILLLGRRKLEIPPEDGINQAKEEESGRLKQEIVDMEQMNEENSLNHFQEKDVFFSCFGTTRRAAGSAENFRHIDKGYNMKCAELARKANIPMYSLQSSQGAKASSWMLYLKVKGQIDEEVSKMGFPILSIFRPGMLDRGTQARFVEKVAGWFMGKISVQTVAKAMCTDAINQLTKGAGEEARSVIYENPQIHGIVDEHPKASEKENAGTSQKSKTEEKTSTEDKPETQEQREETKAPETESASETAKTTEEPATGEAVVDEKKE